MREGQNPIENNCYSHEDTKVTLHLPDPLQDVGSERRHSRWSTSKLHQHREQFEEGIGSLKEEDDREEC